MFLPLAHELAPLALDLGSDISHFPYDIASHPLTSHCPPCPAIPRDCGSDLEEAKEGRRRAEAEQTA